MAERAVRRLSIVDVRGNIHRGCSGGTGYPELRPQARQSMYERVVFPVTPIRASVHASMHPFISPSIHSCDPIIKKALRCAWVARSVERPTAAQVTISQFVGSSPTSGSVLMA